MVRQDFMIFLGDFHPMQLVDVIGQVADFFSPLILHHEVIQTVSLQLLGRANVIRMKKEPVFNPGKMHFRYLRFCLLFRKSAKQALLRIKTLRPVKHQDMAWVD